MVKFNKICIHFVMMSQEVKTVTIDKQDHWIVSILLQFDRLDDLKWREHTDFGQVLTTQQLAGIILCSENKAHQLHSYCTADLRLCFCICKKQVFS